MPSSPVWPPAAGLWAIRPQLLLHALIGSSPALGGVRIHHGRDYGGGVDLLTSRRHDGTGSVATLASVAQRGLASADCW